MKIRSRLFCRRLAQAALRAGLIVALAGGVVVTSSIAPIEVHAQTEIEDGFRGSKIYWQERYRTLRNEEARLRKKAEVARTKYAAANRRNYRRGTNRREQRLIAIEAETELVRVKEELAGLAEEARVSGALPGWLREVEDEPPAGRESLPKVATDGAKDQDGRNPLHHSK